MYERNADDEGEVAVQHAETAYPRLWQAVLLLFFVFLAGVLFNVVLSVAFGSFGLALPAFDHGIIWSTRVASFSVVLLWAAGRSRRRATKVFPLSRFPAGLVVPLRPFSGNLAADICNLTLQVSYSSFVGVAVDDLGDGRVHEGDLFFLQGMFGDLLGDEV